MKTKVIKYVPPAPPKVMTVAEFAELHDLTMVIEEHPPSKRNVRVRVSAGLLNGMFPSHGGLLCTRQAG